MKIKQYLILDFDSTFTKTEALEELAKLIYPNNMALTQEIEAITKLGMNGEISFPESLNRRLKLLKLNRQAINRLVRLIKTQISDSILMNKQFFLNNREQIYIVSGGFHDFIDPVVIDFGIAATQVLANRFVFNNQGEVVGYKSEGSKLELVRSLNLVGEVIMVGDGFTDWEVKSGGAATKFIAFIENVKRKAVIEKADLTRSSFTELLADLH